MEVNSRWPISEILSSIVGIEAEASGEAAAGVVAMLTNQLWPKPRLEASEHGARERERLIGQLGLKVIPWDP